jgi:aryl-alcohol dehydrogenase-like predicted oxidoreductase
MEYRPFGKTDLKISAIGFGCWEIGGTYGRIDETQFGRAVQQAIDNGMACFDTAEAYGMGVSEEALARALGSRRREVTIVTKFGVGYEEVPSRRDSSRGRVLVSIEKSLQRLQTDHVDAYLVHWPDPDTPLDETMHALDDIVRQGKARYIGVSNFGLRQIEDCIRLRRVDVVQYGWNMFDRRMQADIFPYCAAHQIGVMAYGSLAYTRGRTGCGTGLDCRACRRASASRSRQDPAAVRAALDIEQPDRRHGAGRISRTDRGGGKPGRPRLGNLRRRYGGD